MAVKKGISLRKLHEIDADEVSPIDSRPSEMRALTTVSGEVMDMITDVFAGTGVAQDHIKVQAILDARRAVLGGWDKAARAYLEIGRALNELDGKLRRKEEKLRLKAGFERLFPFSDSIGSQLRRVAEMVDSGRVPETQLPGSYSAAYQIALLDQEDLEAARERGLLRPETSRSAVIAFRRERVAATPSIDLNALEMEARRIRETRRRMLHDLIRMRRRAQEIARLLASDE